MVWFILFYTGFAMAGIFRFQDIEILNIVIGGNVQAAIICLSMREAAYMAEVIRGGILSVEQGQVDASKSLGMSWWQSMYRITLPQSLRVVVPPMGNNFNIMLKTTALASVIGVEELFLTTRTISAATFKVFEMFLVLAIAYLIITMGWSLLQTFMEYRLNRHEQDPEKSFIERIKTYFNFSNNNHRDGDLLGSIKNLNKYFGNNHVLNNVSTDLKKGEVMSIIGPSGSGKSTFLKCINFLEYPTSGSVNLNGEYIGFNQNGKLMSENIIHKQRKKFGMVFQNFNLFWHMNLIENIIEAPIRVLKIEKNKAISIAEDLLEKVGLIDKRFNFPKKLSGGQQQRGCYS